MITATPHESTLRKIEKAQITWPSTKTQMLWGGALIVLSCFVSYAGTLGMGFLLDDYLHVDYAARALHGDLPPLLNNLVSNWGGSDIMKSYRPIVSLSIFLDYVIFHTNAFGYHLTNLLLFAASALLVSLITLEITGRLESRGGALTAIWAGLLFSVYPLHAESVAWIIGRVDLLATAFYLASIFCFLRLELLKERGYLSLSLIYFVLALASKEIAVSLPVAVVALATLPDASIDRQAPQKKADSVGYLRDVFRRTWPYFATIAVFALVRHFLLGTTIGGYGQTDLLSSLKNFLNRESLTKIFVPVSEEYLPVRAMAAICIGPVVAAAVIFALRQLALYTANRFNKTTFTAPLVVLAWAGLALLPAFQIWHIYPNLVGSRLFFLSSVGLCAGLALLALPSAERIDKKTYSITAALPVVAMAALYVVWFACLQVNLRPWIEASSRVAIFKKAVRATADALPRGSDMVILNVPQDYKGAGMVGRQLYLDILNRPPFDGEDLAKRLVSVEPLISGDRTFIWPGRLEQAIKKAGAGSVFIWSNQDSTLTPAPVGVPQTLDESKMLATQLEQKLAALPSLEGGTSTDEKAGKTKWLSLSPEAILVRTPLGEKDVKPGYIELSTAQSHIGQSEQPGGKSDEKDKTLTFWLPARVDSKNVANQILSIDIDDDDEVGMASKCKLFWRGTEKDATVYSATAFNDNNLLHHGRYLFDLARYRSYVLAKGPIELGLQFDLSKGPVRLNPGSLALGPITSFAPQLQKEDDVLVWDATAAAQNHGKSFTKINFLLTDKNGTVDPVNEYDIYRPAALEHGRTALTLPLGENLRGKIALSTLLQNGTISDLHLEKPDGLRELVIVLSSDDGKNISLPSEPVTFK